MKRLIFSILPLILACGLLAGCSKGKTTSALTPQNNTAATTVLVANSVDSVSVGIPAGIPTLDPYASGSSVGGIYVWQAIYQPLFGREVLGGALLPMIGKEVVFADDYSSATVKLYDYVYDSSGKHITSDDVIYSYNTVINLKTWTNVTSNIDKVEAIDDYTVKISVVTPRLNSLEDILSQIFIVSKDSYNPTTAATKPIATGPYTVNNYIAGTQLVLDKQENYWQKPDLIHPLNIANAKRIVFKIILETAQMAIALETGDIDIAASINPDELVYFVDKNGNTLPDYTVNSINTNLFNNMAFNMAPGSRVSANLKLRQAILYAIDSKALVQGVLGSAGSVVKSWGCNVYPDYNPKWDSEDYYDFDLEKAKALIKDSGYNGESIRIMCENNAQRSKAAQLIQGFLLEIGVKTDILIYDAALFSTYRYEFDQWDIILDNQANSAALAALWGNFLTQARATWKGVGVTYNGLHDDTLENLVQKAVAINGHSTQDMDAVHYYLKDNAIVYGLWAGYIYQVSQSGVTSIKLTDKLYLCPGACTFSPNYKSKS